MPMPDSTPSLPTGLHPTARPEERRQDIEFTRKDDPLRRDVHELGGMIGELLREQRDEALYAAVEQARRTAIAWREGRQAADADISRQLQQFDTRDMRDFARAFAIFFQMVNTAEQVHRIRRSRELQREASAPPSGSIRETFLRLREQGLDLAATKKLMASLGIMPVFSAHPTAPTRRTILRKQRVIATQLTSLQRRELTPAELAACLAAIRCEITSIWQTEEYPGGRRTVFDELEHTLFFMTDVIYPVMPAFHEAIEQAALAVHGESMGDLPPIIRFASWIGGDMEAAPEITARTIRGVLARQRSLILDLYFRECRELADRLSQSSSRTGTDGMVHARIKHYAGHFGQAMGAIPLRHRDMPYRVLLRLMMARLQATHDDASYPYESPEELLGDIHLITQSLRNNRGSHAGLQAVRELQQRVAAFGFHFMTLDLRQDVTVLRELTGHGLDDPRWLARSPAERAARIRIAIQRNESPSENLDNDTRRALAIFQAIAFCRRKYGQQAMGPFIVSGDCDVDDLLSVLLLARWGDLHGPVGSVPLDVVPLFDAPGHLQRADSITGRLLQDPVYREHLEQREQRQMIMFGYSESSRLDGIASARWLLKQTQASLMQVMDQAGIAFTFFHGHGSAMTAGGGKTAAAIQMSPSGATRSQLRAIDQGELLSTKYGFRGVARLTLERAAGSVALATARPRQDTNADLQERQRIMEAFAAASRSHHQALVSGTPGFAEYFQRATPADALAYLHRQTDTAAALSPQHLPWAAAWSQSRMMMPGWYGFGTGLDAILNSHGADALREMATGWDFFRLLLGDVELALAKSDLGIGLHYSRLADSLHEEIFPRLQAEFLLCTERLLELLGQTVLLEKNETLRRSIRLRNPYVDPLSLLQVELLRRWRASGRQDPELFEALVASINGITLGLQDSG